MVKKRILVAPLNWGLGHATRCIPIINALLERGFEPVLASDGSSLKLLKTEFPLLESYELPSYNIRYSTSAFFFRTNLFLQAPHIIKTITAEKKLTACLVREKNISGIISDNRWGVRSEMVPSVFMTHQVNVFSGFTTFLSSSLHKRYIGKFDECWVPDHEGSPNLSGKMGHISRTRLNLKYIGILSRFQKQNFPVKYDIAAILSGPEPQRGILEKILKKELANKNLKILLVRGVVETKQKCETKSNITIYNFLTSVELEELLNQSNLVICRPGYTSLMDMAVLEKRVFVIPTPGQYEQEYLFRRLLKKGFISGCLQHEFKYEILKAGKIKQLSSFTSRSGFDGIFTLFQGK